MSGEVSSIMAFLKEFKTTVEDKFEQTDNKNEDTNRRIEKKMDHNFEEMKQDMLKMAEQNEKDNNELSRRLAALEEDVKRLKFAKMNSLVRNQGAGNEMQVLPLPNQPLGRKQLQDQPGRKSPVKKNRIQPLGRNTEENRRQLPLQYSLTSWVEEQENKLARAAAMSGNYNGRQTSDAA